MAKSSMEKWGSYAFLAGVVLAALVGVLIALGVLTADMIGTATIIMVLLGLVVGLLNIKDKEVNSFIIAAIGLSVGSIALQSIGNLLALNAATNLIGIAIYRAFAVFATFVAAAVFIPALKAVWAISQD